MGGVCVDYQVLAPISSPPPPPTNSCFCNTVCDVVTAEHHTWNEPPPPIAASGHALHPLHTHHHHLPAVPATCPPAHLPHTCPPTHLAPAFKRRVMVIYNGVHYDALAVAAHPRAPPEEDVTEFNPRTKRGKMILAAAKKLVGGVAWAWGGGRARGEEASAPSWFCSMQAETCSCSWHDACVSLPRT